MFKKILLAGVLLLLIGCNLGCTTTFSKNFTIIYKTSNQPILLENGGRIFDCDNEACTNPGTTKDRPEPFNCKGNNCKAVFSSGPSKGSEYIAVVLKFSDKERVSNVIKDSMDDNAAFDIIVTDNNLILKNTTFIKVKLKFFGIYLFCLFLISVLIVLPFTLLAKKSMRFFVSVVIINIFSVTIFVLMVWGADEYLKIVGLYPIFAVASWCMESFLISYYNKKEISLIKSFLLSLGIYIIGMVIVMAVVVVLIQASM
jgi:hypothetical protein